MADNLEFERLKNEHRELEQENKRLEELVEELQIKFVHANSAASLMAGIAHELNTPIQFIAANANYLLSEGDKDPKEIKECLKEIEEGALRLRNLTKTIMEFIRAEREEYRFESKPYQITSLIDESIEVIRFKDAYPNIRLIREYDDELYQVNVNNKQMNRVYVNMLINAVDAMPDGGTLTLRAKNHYGKPSEKLRTMQYVLTEIEDTGEGIPESIIDRIFDAFFTANERKKGTGIGLSVCHSIIEKHKGCITVESEVGKGTKFNIYVPTYKES